MAVKFKWPILGIIIPIILVSTVGYGSYFFVFREHLEERKKNGFLISLCILWITYLIAIKSQPGRPPKTFKPRAGEWRRWCKKCENYKPERTHHCKTCNQCVLRMDHHCPWTMNCVGHKNFPHFMRYLVAVVCNGVFVLVELSKRAYQYYEDRDLPSYLINKKEMVAVIALLPLDFFLTLTVSILLVRCIINHLFYGMTQIEIWEKERIESQFHTERMWLQIRKNYQALHGKPMPKLTSWMFPEYYELPPGVEEEEVEEDEFDSNDGNSLKLDNIQVEDHMGSSANAPPEDSIVPANFTIDDLVFPYDLGFFRNLFDYCNFPWFWPLLFVGPRTNGVNYKKSEYTEDDQLGLPWPPDGGHSEYVEPSLDDLPTSVAPHQVAAIRKRLDPRANMSRDKWMNDLGETLDDFGVDVDAEDAENDVLLSIHNN